MLTCIFIFKEVENTEKKVKDSGISSLNEKTTWRKLEVCIQFPCTLMLYYLKSLNKCFSMNSNISCKLLSKHSIFNHVCILLYTIFPVSKVKEKGYLFVYLPIPLLSDSAHLHPYTDPHPNTLYLSAWYMHLFNSPHGVAVSSYIFQSCTLPSALKWYLFPLIHLSNFPCQNTLREAKALLITEQKTVFVICTNCVLCCC